MIIANSEYRNHPNLPEAAQVTSLAQAFHEAGFVAEVFENTVPLSDRHGRGLWDRLAKTDRFVVVLSGHFVSTRGQNWLLHSGAGRMTAFTMGQEALPIDPFLDLAAQRPGQRIIVLADTNINANVGPGISDALQLGDIPQGVTIVHGPAGAVVGLVAGAMVQPGATMADVQAAAPEGVTVAGFVPRHVGVVAGAAVTVPEPFTDPAVEQAFWGITKAQDTVEAYETYLERYPNGQFVQDASQRLKDLSLSPEDKAKLAEEALGLSRDQRRALQRQLTILGFDTRGVDGLFGQNTRAAVANWQTSVGIPANGYLTANQVSRIEAAAAVRAEELRLEAEARRVEEERQDQAYWAETGALESEAGYRAYLEKYPDGLHAGTARDALGAIERERRRQAEAEERQAWDEAVIAGDVAAYQSYLDRYPQGLFASEAQARLQVLQNPETAPEVIAAAQAAEQRLSLNPFTRQLIEAQLRALNLNPGPVDGRFTEETRAALRNYQRATNQQVTGYVTRDTIVLLLASAID